MTAETSSTRVVIAPYLDERGFVPRVYRVGPDGYPVAKVDGPRGFRTWEEAAEASRFLTVRVEEVPTTECKEDAPRVLGAHRGRPITPLPLTGRRR